MAVGNLVGFLTGDSGELQLLSGTASVQSTTKRNGTHALQANPTLTGTGYGDVNIGIGVSNPATAFWRTYFRYATKPGANSEPFFQALTAASGLKLEARLDSAGRIAVYDSTGTNLLATGTTVLSANTWYMIQVKVGSSATVGAWEVKINGVSEISGTANTSATVNARAFFGKPTNRNGQTVDFFYSDIIVDDAAYIGEGEIKAIVVDSNGATNQWSAGTGTGFAEVDDGVTADDVTTYLPSTANGDTHSLGLTSCASVGITGTINAVKAAAKTSRSGGANGSVATRIRSGGTNSDSGLVSTISAWTWRQFHVRSTDPATSAAWTTSAIDSMEVGVVASGGNQSRVTSLVAFVDFTAPTGSDLASAGTGAATLTGAATGSGVKSSAGTGAALIVGASIAAAVFSSAGVASVSQVGAAQAQSTFASAGVADAPQVGQSTASATLASAGLTTVGVLGESTASGAMSAAGVATVSGVGASSAASALSAAGVADAPLVGAAEVAGALSASGVADAPLIGAAEYAAALSASGAASVDLVGSFEVTGGSVAASTSVGSAAFVGNAEASAPVSASGAAAVALVGAAEGTAPLATSGAAAVAFVGTSVVDQQSASNASGVGTATFVGAADASSALASVGLADAPLASESLPGFGSTTMAGTSTASFVGRRYVMSNSDSRRSRVPDGERTSVVPESSRRSFVPREE